MRLDAGIGALPDPSVGALAMGAVVPPGADAGQRNAPPDYPPESRRRGEEGVVRLALRVAADGRVESAEVSASSGHPRLDQAAVEAARRWRFRPAMQAGQPVAATLPTAVHFRLTDTRGR
jgi:protein TonB